ncbi:MAG: transcriptional repressor [Dehalococcoidia bacterium]|nr:transcriptional repressor [Dehalococcoidia bacterium]MSQ35190.1 transcriptional repressor [Dehalococcoidia bacterium]
MTLAPARRDLQAALQDRGYRLTGPRKRVAEAVGRKQEDGFTAESLCAEVQDTGRATVYRTLKLLLEAGVVCKLPMPDGAPRYMLAQLEHHHHTVCVRCGAVGEFRDTTVERVVRSMGKEITGEIVGHRMEFYIICTSCKAARKA